MKEVIEPSKEYKKSERFISVVKIKRQDMPGKLNSPQIMRNIENKNKTTEKEIKRKVEEKRRENIIDINHFRIFKIKDTGELRIQELRNYMMVSSLDFFVASYISDFLVEVTQKPHRWDVLF